MDLNPHKPRHEPLPEAPEGYIWYGVYPNVELITFEELRRRIGEMFETQLQKRKLAKQGDADAQAD
ncbi:hypothetical protein MTBPR1_120100 [Candidatus Terasakiella magnetica]|uniref:Uncharacterized protein n=1 Tax=Candidatus Terasakiella magnetica TaxID=1867952 RepID=A0A1C3RF02_9PROT|nr:hypothetical protein [Candidatus Terasakiella magnetica]SCA55794.1 hypothetical protein MTBPR1_120100 [Candidatus Terasakiella magnetica]